MNRRMSKDDREAVEWCRQEAEQGHALAQYKLGVMYAFGMGVTKFSDQHRGNSVNGGCCVSQGAE